MYQQGTKSKCKVIALANQKGGTAKTTTTVNLGIGLVNQGHKVLLVDANPQGDLITALGWTDADNLSITLATQMEKTNVPFINKFPKNTRLYKLMTTKPGEDSANRNRT